MGKLINFVCFLLLNLCTAQTQRIVYEYSYKIDSLHLDETNKDIMFLDIYQDFSLFVSQEKLTQDSLFSIGSFRNTNSNVMYKTLKNDFCIVKEKEKINHYENIGNTRFKINESKDLLWEISTQTKIYEGYQLQKATCDYGGRNWVAWFANDLLILDGPYVFCSLPGLIFEIYDLKEEHQFKLIGILKKENLNRINEKNSVSVSEKEFNKFWNDYKLHPLKFVGNQSFSVNNSTSYSITFNGKTYTENEINQQIEKQAFDKIKKYNNFINLELYKK